MIQLQAPLQSVQEVVGVVALEGKAQAAFALFVHGRHGVLQTAGGVNHRHGAVAHGVHLAQAAGFTLGGHEVDVAAGINPGGKPQIEGNLGSYPVGELLGKLLEELLKASLAGAQNQQLGVFLPHKLPGDVAQQIQSLVAHQPGDHDHEGHIRRLGQTHFLLEGCLAGGLSFPEGVGVVVSWQSRVGLRVEGVHIDAVGDTGELPGCGSQDAVQPMGIVGIHQLLGVGLGHGGNHVSGLNGALHHVDAAAHVQGGTPLPGQSQHIVKEAAFRPALILHVVDGEHALGVRQEGLILGLQQGGNQCGLPVVALNHIGDEIQIHQGVQAGLGKEGEAFAVVNVAVDGALSGTEVVQTVDEVHLHPIFPVLQPVDAGVLIPPAQAYIKLGNLLHFILGVVQNLLVVGKNQHDLVAGNPGQGGGQGLHHVSQTAGFDIGCAFGGQHGDFHTISPRLIITGVVGEPMRVAPGRTTTSLSRITFFRTQPSPMTASFMMTQFST